MSKNVIDDEKKKKIAAAYDLMTAKAVGEEYGISERQVRRIAKEVASWPADDAQQDRDDEGEMSRDDPAKGGEITPYYIKAQLVRIYGMQIEAAENYHRMASEEPTRSNCAWGNLEQRLLKDAKETIMQISTSARIGDIEPYKIVGKEPEELVYRGLKKQMEIAHLRNVIQTEAMLNNVSSDWCLKEYDARVQSYYDDDDDDDDDF